MKQEQVQTDTTIAQICNRCKKTVTIHVVGSDLKKWMDGELIQNCMGYLSVDEREILISGVCGQCFDEMFK